MSYPVYVDKTMCKDCLIKALLHNDPPIEITHVIKIIAKDICKINANTFELHKRLRTKINV